MDNYKERQVECAKILRKLLLRRHKSLNKQFNKLFMYAPELVDDDNVLGGFMDFLLDSLADMVFYLENYIDDARCYSANWGSRSRKLDHTKDGETNGSL